jgi:ribonuclease HII
MFIGVDEAGLGAWAGPAAVGGVLVTDQWDVPPGLTDSKKLSPSARDKLFASLSNDSALWSCVEWVSQEAIDELNPRAACEAAIKVVIRNLLGGLDPSVPVEIVVDGTYNIQRVGLNQVTCVPKADLNYPYVSAASIFAKVSRDRHMVKLGLEYPLYKFGGHKGYGTKQHREALEEHGLIPGVHRMSYKPMKEMT